MPDVSSFTQTGVKFTDGSSVDIDEVIFSTGFNNSCSFIDDEDIYPGIGFDIPCYFPKIIVLNAYTLSVYGTR